MPVICAERANETLPTVSAERKQTYCPLYDSSSSVISVSRIYGCPSVSLPIREASQVLAEMVYRSPVVPDLSSITALTVFSRAVPASGSTTDITGPVRSMSVICADRANETLLAASRARKQTYCPLYDSLSSVMFVPET